MCAGRVTARKCVADPPLLRQRNILEGVSGDLLVPVATIVPEAVVALGVLHLRPVLLVAAMWRWEALTSRAIEAPPLLALGFPRVTMKNPTVFQRDAYVSDVSSPSWSKCKPLHPTCPLSAKS